jgi:hypothetical protein
MFEKITIDKIEQDAIGLEFNSESYLISYPEFLKYFKKKRSIKKSHLIIGIHFTYGWMPTVFDFRSNEFKKAVKILNKSKGNNLLTIEELSILKSLFNNSLVGTSKLLHFINPSIYPIWDSRVYRYLTNKESSNKLNEPETYLSYLNFCSEKIKDKKYNSIHKSIKEKIGQNLTKLRSLELIMYMNGVKKKT